MPKPSKSSNQKERVPVGVRRQKLTAPLIPGYHTHWMNDDPSKGDRIQECLDGGYTFVNNPDVVKSKGVNSGDPNETEAVDSRMCRHVGLTRDGKPMKAYYMKIPQKLYDQDQKEKLKPAEEIDRQIKSGQLDLGGLGASKYTPKGGSNITVDK